MQTVPNPIVITKKDLMDEESHHPRHLAAKPYSMVFTTLTKGAALNKSKRKKESSAICWWKIHLFESFFISTAVNFRDEKFKEYFTQPFMKNYTLLLLNTSFTFCISSSKSSWSMSIFARHLHWSLWKKSSKAQGNW